MPLPRRILLVEDRQDDADLFELAIREAGLPWTIVRVSLLSEAVARLAPSHEIDAVVLDIHLPDTAGVEAVARLRAAAPQVPIIVLTGTGDTDVTSGVDALKLGADDYLPKGSSGTAIHRAVMYAVERRRASEERERLIRELQAALESVKALTGLLPMCSSCRRIRSEDDSWDVLEGYLAKHSDTRVTHGICPECTATVYPDFARRKAERG